MEFFVLCQDIIVLFFNKGIGFFGVIDLADFMEVAKENMRLDASNRDETKNDRDVFK